ncbi:MAG: tetratricopeptide repeat protein, partial [Candidatus Omnitrophica bacterium]|nr:tetratricopeptide repeat protein [Candidatus Omnitrophota bacterium]
CLLLFDSGRYCLAAAGFVFSLLSRESGVMFLLLLFLWHLARKPDREESVYRRERKIIGFVFVPLTLVYVVFRFTVLHLSKMQGEPFLIRFLTAQRALLDYLRLLVWPSSLSMERHLSFITQVTAAWVIGGFFTLVVLLLLVFFTRKERLFFLPVCWFLVNYLSVSGMFIPLNGNLSEHWMYLASMGFWIGVVFGIKRFVTNSLRREKLALVILSAASLLYATRSIIRNRDWQDPLSFFQKAIRVSPHSSSLHHNLGSTLTDRGQHKEALRYFEKAIELNPNFVLALIGAARCHCHLGNLERSLVFYKKALAIKPDHPFALFDLATMALEKGDYQQAAKQLNTIFRTSPAFQPAWRVAGNLELRLGNSEKALFFYRRAVKMNPEDDIARNGLGVAYQRLGKIRESILEFQAACRLKPDEPGYWQNLAKAYQQVAQYQASIQAYQRCLVLSPDNLEVMNDLGISLAMAGQVSQAVALWEKVLETNPDFQPAIENLRLAQKNLKR